MDEKIGVYICRCGTNISAKVDVEQVAEFVRSLQGVAVARIDSFLCSGTGQELIERDLREKGISRVVVAACSPHLHEPTFRTACGRAGLNPYSLEMANIREQTAWVTSDRAAATEKAKGLAAAAVQRVKHHKPLERVKVPVTRAVLVVGGGIAGITAAREIADAGYHVYLVEREPGIGGRMAQLDKVFPTLDCTSCTLDPLLFTVERHPRITLLSFSEVEGVKGSVGSFEVTVRKKTRLINEERCTGCRVCQQECPKKVVDASFEAGLGYRTACYFPSARAVPNLPVIDRDSCLYFKGEDCRVCRKRCPAGAVDFSREDETVCLKVGSILLATGYNLFDPRKIPQYGYGRYLDVFTSLEFERMLSATGPTGGRIVLRDGATEPRSVAIIHCVGSRDKNYHPYCSRVCCMYSLKFAHLIMERTGATVYNFYLDMRTPGKGFEEFYHRLLEEGARFIRGRAAMIMDTAYSPAEEGKLVVQAEDTLLGRQRRIPVDMVILSPALEARADAKEMARLFGIGLDGDGFFLERQVKLDPTATQREGIFIAGACQGPKDSADAVAQAGAAAARIISLLNRGAIEVEPFAARVHGERCSGCRVCSGLCPYGALSFMDADNTAAVNPALCQGCGTCAPACPCKAIESPHFTDEQILAELEGLLTEGIRLKSNSVMNPPLL